MAVALGVTDTTIGRWLKGVVVPTRIGAFERLAKASGQTPGQWLDLALGIRYPAGASIAAESQAVALPSSNAVSLDAKTVAEFLEVCARLREIVEAVSAAMQKMGGLPGIGSQLQVVQEHLQRRTVAR